jgi:hypothetical protein
MHWSTSLAARSATVGGRLLSEAFRVTALTLAYATPTGEWRPFGRLRLTGPHDAASPDPVVRFAPVDATPVGLQQCELMTGLRGQSYGGARAGFSGGAAVAP